MKDHPALCQTRDWVEGVIMRYNLCPFARREVERGSIRYVAFDAASLPQVLEQLAAECHHLDSHPQTETTLCVLTEGFGDFDAFLELVQLAEALLQAQGYEGTYQLASFHPDYCFAGEPPSDPANYTNRSPWPTLHLIREQSIDRARADYGDAEGIPRRNIEFARRRGEAFFLELLANLGRKHK